MDKIDWNSVTEDSLKQSNIFALRDMCRLAGVASPTTYNKAGLIEKLLEVKKVKAPVQVQQVKPEPEKTAPKPEERKEIADKRPMKSERFDRQDRQDRPDRQDRQDRNGGKRFGNGSYEAKPRQKMQVGESDNKNGYRTMYFNGQNSANSQKTDLGSPSGYGSNQNGGNSPSANYSQNASGYGNGQQNGYRPKEIRRTSSDEEISLDQCEIRSGILEILADGYGFLRADNFRNSPKDSYVATAKIRRMGLRAGDYVTAYCRPASAEGGKPPAVVSVQSVNGKPLSYLETRPDFDRLVPIFPTERLRLELAGQRNELAVRAIDLIAPIGKGQRAMLVSPPKAGKTTLLKMIANSISINHPECKLMVLLIDERPEEVTDMQRSTKGEVIYSTFDEESDNHIKVAELVLARAKRMVEDGKDVVILLDSLTRMARASNVIVPSSGKTLSGGVDPVALYMPKRFFGAARNIENGGSLTIIATALVDTGSRMDDIVYEEFKGTGNMEIHLDRRLSEKRIFPAIDLLKSGTRREELLLSQKELEGAYTMRRLLSAGDTQEATETIITMMQKTVSNDELMVQLGLQLKKLSGAGFRF